MTQSVYLMPPGLCLLPNVLLFLFFQFKDPKIHVRLLWKSKIRTEPQDIRG